MLSTFIAFCFRVIAHSPPPSLAETNLVQISIDDIARAHQIMGRKTSQGYLPIVLVPRPSSCVVALQLPAGMSAIVTKNGKCEGVYTPGCHCRFGWTDVAYLVTQASSAYFGRGGEGGFVSTD